MQSHEPSQTTRFVRVRTLAAQLDVSVATIWRWAAEGRIPRPVKLSPGVTAWNAAAVSAALAAREQA